MSFVGVVGAVSLTIAAIITLVILVNGIAMAGVGIYVFWKLVLLSGFPFP